MFVDTGLPHRKAACDGQTLRVALGYETQIVVIASPEGKPAFTVRPESYPITIVLGGMAGERICLTSPPDSAESPQVFSGVLRGFHGTTRREHEEGEPVFIVQPEGAAYPMEIRF